MLKSSNNQRSLYLQLFKNNSLRHYNFPNIYSNVRTEPVEYPILTSEQPKLEPLNYPKHDLTKAYIAYGLWGIPILIRQLHSEDYHIKSCALASLIDELTDPEKCYRAIIEFHVVKRLSDVLCKLSLVEEYQLEKTCLNLALIASYYEGAIRLIEESLMIDNLYDLIRNKNNQSSIMALILSNMSNHFKVAKIMVDEDHLLRIYEIIHDDTTINLYNFYVELSNLIETDSDKALTIGYFDLLVNIFENR